LFLGRLTHHDHHHYLLLILILMFLSSFARVYSSFLFVLQRLRGLEHSDVYVVFVVDCILDLTYIVDSSGSINDKDPRNWNITLEFLVNLTRLFVVGPDNVQVAFVLFSEFARIEWNLTRYQDQASLIAAIQRVPYLGQYTNLNDALYLTRTQVYAPGQGTRQGAIRATIILTDGVDNIPTNGTELTIQNATAAKNAGIRLTAVGVSNQVNVERLRDQIASRPSNRHYYHVDDFDALMEIVTLLSPTVCGGTLAVLIHYHSLFYTSSKYGSILVAAEIILRNRLFVANPQKNGCHNAKSQ